LVFCDWYGNELGRKSLTNIRQMPALIEQARTEMLKEQMRLEVALGNKLQKIEKDIEKKIPAANLLRRSSSS